METQNKKKNQQTYSLKSVIRTIIITILVTVILTAVGYPIGIKYAERTTAARTLTNARTVLTAMHVIGLEEIGNLRQMTDSTSFYGMNETERQRVLNLASAEGEVYLIKWDAVDLEADRMLYVQEGYAASFTRYEDDTTHWEVYKLDSIIS